MYPRTTQFEIYPSATRTHVVFLRVYSNIELACTLNARLGSLAANSSSGSAYYVYAAYDVNIVPAHR